MTVIVHDAPGAAPSTATVAVDPGFVAIVTEATLNTCGGVGEAAARGVAVGVLAAGVDVGVFEAGVADGVRSATVACATTVDAGGVATGLGEPDELPPHPAATTTSGVKNINNAFRTTTSRSRSPEQ